MIEVKDLQFTDPGNREKTIKGLDFSISKGEIFGLLGPSSAGKSTTQKIIIGILKGYSGQVKAIGKELKSADQIIMKRSVWLSSFRIYIPSSPRSRSLRFSVPSIPERPNHSLPWWGSKTMEKEEFLSFPKA